MVTSSPFWSKKDRPREVDKPILDSFLPLWPLDGAENEVPCRVMILFAQLFSSSGSQNEGTRISDVCTLSSDCKLEAFSFSTLRPRFGVRTSVVSPAAEWSDRTLLSKSMTLEVF
ncbi:hypothetical protein BpHYR1_016431 [Brachionus plicatilis]|uniref:Uncharacterized protein n=1 Tax=Brachionus plicatilis TaxID=10195 RepID=A0A3M7RQ80_BRAPC|nr:hypothetical protein BpHYR1_016431 [Brachionus plicatilis]